MITRKLIFPTSKYEIYVSRFGSRREFVKCVTTGAEIELDQISKQLWKTMFDAGMQLDCNHDEKATVLDCMMKVVGDIYFQRGNVTQSLEDLEALGPKPFAHSVLLAIQQKNVRRDT